MAYKTPGVYIQEKSAFGNSVVEVATAIPVFIGHTEFALDRGKSLAGKPWAISSLAEYHQYFGSGPAVKFELKTREELGSTDSAFTLGKVDYATRQLAGVEGGRYLLYFAIRHFFMNGGGRCYILSVGDYGTDIDGGKIVENEIIKLEKEQEPTMVLVPDAVLLDEAQCAKVQVGVLEHCGKLRNRVAIFDIWNGGNGDPRHASVDAFRTAIGRNSLDFGVAYYPWLNTSLLDDKNFSFDNVANKDALAALIKTELGLDAEATDDKHKAVQAQLLTLLGKMTRDWVAQPPAGDEADVATEKKLVDKTLRNLSPIYRATLADIARQVNCLPPSAAMAGIYTKIDATRGVWKAPANVSLNGVISPTVEISHSEQENLNVDINGKSINALRTFIGEGVLVWGGRTLDGNSLDWRYVNVRRTMIMLEESCRLAAKALVFEPNVANTWVTVRSMITNFLTSVWKRGGLAGASPEDAFSVHVGLGETMTPEDILEGIMRITVLVAITRPAEFIEITFQQQMQKS
ncbi:phage tail sheath family protein [Derxia gummosa]|uniref:Phage tail sheath family protein n=1 Tax=Derxia gummosa DSM 723 TaxID=1121388 RepID=A0A8B6X493_9BURK|nr:phage tail sheath C-terminal domain-containing protein [Derxia gummosa]